MTDSTKIYLDMADDSILWTCLHADASQLPMHKFTTMHGETIRQHYRGNGRLLNDEDAEDMAREIWWDVRMFGVDPESPVQLSQKTGTRFQMDARHS